MKKQNSSLSLHNFLNENIPNLVNLREKTEKRSHLSKYRSQKALWRSQFLTKTAVLSEFNNKLTNRHAKLHKIKTSTCLLKVFQGLLFPSLLNFPFTTHTRIVTCQKSRIFEP